MAKRQIVSINEELCNGCGVCVTPCAGGAIVLENSKARIADEQLCDGIGFCVPFCPTGALTIGVREAPPFDAKYAEQHTGERSLTYIAQRCFRCTAGEDEYPSMPIRYQGRSLWVCARCLPHLVHGDSDVRYV